MTNLHPPPFPIATGRLITDTTEMDWTQYTYWVESSGPLVVISEQQKLVKYVESDPVSVLVDVPEPNYIVVVMLMLVLIVSRLELKGTQPK